MDTASISVSGLVGGTAGIDLAVFAASMSGLLFGNQPMSNAVTVLDAASSSVDSLIGIELAGFPYGRSAVLAHRGEFVLAGAGAYGLRPGQRSTRSHASPMAGSWPAGSATTVPGKACSGNC